MEIVLYVDGDKAEKLRNILLKDDVVSKANVVFREAKLMNKEGFYVRIIGTKEQCEKAIELSEELAEEVSGEEKEKILEMLRKEDEEMLSGFSGVFR